MKSEFMIFFILASKPNPGFLDIIVRKLTSLIKCLDEEDFSSKNPKSVIFTDVAIQSQTELCYLYCHTVKRTNISKIYWLRQWLRVVQLYFGPYSFIFLIKTVLKNQHRQSAYTVKYLSIKGIHPGQTWTNLMVQLSRNRGSCDLCLVLEYRNVWFSNIII